MTISTFEPRSTRHQFGCAKFMTKERIRYQRKGYGLLFATFFAALFFFGVPHMAQLYWPAILKLISDHELSYTSFYLIWGLCQHNLIHLIGHSVFYLYYRLEIPCIERYKTNYNEPWPWHEDPEGWRKKVFQSVAVFFFNSNVLLGTVIWLMGGTALETQHTMDLDKLPTPQHLAVTITFCMLCEDFTFYWSHRLLHHPWLYPRIHKIHHSFIQTVSIASEYAHPVEFLLGNLLPTSVGPALLGSQMHIVSVFAWYAVRVGETLDGHCGYDFSFSPYRLIPFSGSAEYHDFHHSQNVGNYASFFSVWDSVFGTNQVFNKMTEHRIQQ